MRGRSILLGLALAALLVSCGGGESRPDEILMEPGDFALVDHEGREFRLSSLRGRPVLLFFGFTHCPDACPTMMSKLAVAYRLIGADAKAIPVLLVSVDPRDTPPVLKEYLSYFAIPARGLTGSKAQIDDVVKKFAAHYTITPGDSEAGPFVDHTLTLYLIDGNGNVRELFDPTSDPEEIAKAMKKELKRA
ncbi:MAG TPA: SCO family protein [Thermoanaerobaculia bacterium]|nr:SCO family protein [Thermoanaerobaculia bacterium]